MLRVSSILQLQSVWERPSIEDNNSIMTSRLDEHITRTLSHKSFSHQHEEQEINNTNEEMNISALAIATTSAAKMVVPPLESSNSVHSDRGNSKPNKGMVENENSLHASSLNTNVPMSPSSILDENLLRNKPLPELKITTTSSINQQQQTMTSSSSFTSPLSSSSISSTLSSTFHPSQQQQQQQLQNNKVENNDPVIMIQDTTSSISSDSSDSNSSSSSKKANIPSTPKELDDDDDDDSDQKKTAKRKPSFSFKRYSFLNKPDGNGNSPPTSLHSFHLPPSPSLMINGANQALRRESSRLNLRRKSFSKKVKKAISNIKLNNPTPTPAA
ncbi:hypothetical protein BJ944DRAFT_273615 [Cunninghamella echinulata]|nr:hypothetical protein BJ944DRAFT_273615 [Cunninghamella echinulata]